MTSKAWAKPLILAILLCALGLFAFWYENKAKPENEETADLEKKVFPIKNKSIAEIALFQNGKKTVMQCLDLDAKLCKPGDQSKWQITEPLKTQADVSNVNGLLSTLNHIEPKSAVDLKEETPEKRAALLKEYKLYDVVENLKKSTGYIQIKRADGEIVMLSFGENYVTGDSFFALVAKGKAENIKPMSDTVYLIPNYLKESSGKELSHWRNKKLFSWSASEISSFSYAGSKTSFNAKKNENKWTLDFTKPTIQAGLPGDVENVDNFLSVIVNTNAKGFKFDNKSDPSAKAFIATLKHLIRLEIKKGEESLQFDFFEKSGGAPSYYALVNNLDPVFEVDQGANNRFNKDVKDFRLSKLLSSIERFQAVHAAFTWKNKKEAPLKLEKKSGNWNTDEKGYQFKPARIESLLDSLMNSRIESYVLKNKMTPGPDAVTLALGDEKTPEKRVWTFFKSSGKIYAKVHEGDTVELTHEFDKQLPWNRKEFEKFADITHESQPPHSEHDGHTH